MVDSDQRILIFGASGHAKVVIDVVEKQDIMRIGFLADDNTELHGHEFCGYPVKGDRHSLLNQVTGTGMRFIVAVGKNQTRAEIANWLELHGISAAPPAIHPSAQLARGAVIGVGTVLMAGSVVNSDSVIGRNSIVNTGAGIDHDCIIGDAVHIAPGATLCGGISVGDGALIGAGAVLLPNIRIGKNAIIGAGSVVLNDVPESVTVVGNPARKLMNVNK